MRLIKRFARSFLRWCCRRVGHDWSSLGGGHLLCLRCEQIALSDTSRRVWLVKDTGAEA